MSAEREPAETEEMLRALARSMEVSAQLAAALAERLLPATRAHVMSLSAELYNSATELRSLVSHISSVEVPRG